MSNLKKRIEESTETGLHQNLICDLLPLIDRYVRCAIESTKKDGCSSTANGKEKAAAKALLKYFGLPDTEDNLYKIGYA